MAARERLASKLCAVLRYVTLAAGLARTRRLRGRDDHAVLMSVMLAAALALAGVLATAAVASAAETVIDFDTLSAGEIVTNQYEAQGLKLGHAADFGQLPPAVGDCGSPAVVKEELPVRAFSPPNYALLAECEPPVGSVAGYSGTYGALLKSPHAPLSVEVSDLNQAGGPPVKVTVTGYSATGAVMASGEGEAVPDAWTEIVAVNANKGTPPLRYFAITTSEPTKDRIAIDNLDFEAVNEEPPGGGGKGKEEEPGPGGGGKGEETPGSGPPGGGKGGEQPSTGGSGGGQTNPTPAPPTAALALATANPGAGEELALSGAGSQPGSGQIISYDWDLNGDGKIDTSTGTNPIAHVILAPGAHTIGLTVTNSNGQSETTRLGIDLPSLSHVTLPDGGQGPCEPSYEYGYTKILAECVQTLAGGGYVIATNQLDLNGMVLVPKAGGTGIFKIEKVKQHDTTYAIELSGPAVNVELLNTPIGNMVLGGYDLESEPVTLGYENTAVGLMAHADGTEHAAGAQGGPLAHAAGNKGLLLMSLGVGHECEKGAKEVGCCPPEKGTSACATLPGNFPLTGEVIVYLNNKGQVLIDVQVALNLHEVGFEANGELEIVAGLETGIDLSSLKFEIPEASLASIFKVKDASFVYYFPSDPEASKRDTWQAKGGITFAAIEEAGIEGELSFKQGQFHSASLVLTLPPGGGITLYPGIELNKFGGSVGVEPISFGGTLGAAIATQLELTLQFRYAEPFEGQLGYFGGKGSLSLDKDEIATLAADVYSDGYVDAQLKIDLKLPFESKEPIVEVGGGIGFWDEPSSGLWEASGNVFMKIWIINAEVAGLINNKYVAACGNVDGAGGYDDYSFEKGSLDGPGFFLGSNCSDQLKKYKQEPLVKHKGGFVGEESLRSSGPLGDGTPGSSPLGSSPLGDRPSGGSPLRDGPPGSRPFTAHSSATGGGAPLSLPRGLPGEELRITSTSGTPVVSFTTPSGQTFTTPSAPGQVGSSALFIAALGNNPDEVVVLLRHPESGTWHIQQAPGSAPVSEVQGAQDVGPAIVHTHVRHAHGATWKLSYKIGNYVAGTHVTFVEHGHDSTHVLGAVGSAHGTIAFVPQDGAARSRTITAALTNTQGATVRVFTVGHYTAPAAFRPARPRHLRILRHGSTATITWSASPGARFYKVKVRGSDGRLNTLFAKPNHLSAQLQNVIPADSFTATVLAVGGSSLLPGPAATARLRAVKHTKHASAKRGRTHTHKH
jgi:PKD repeat protein